MKNTTCFSSAVERKWAGLFGLAALEALAALAWLAALQADAENAVFLGFSYRRLALIALMALIFIGCVTMALLSWRHTFCARWLNPVLQRRLFSGLLVAFPFGVAVSILIPFLLMSLYRTGGDFRYYAYFERLLPLFAWTGAFFLQGTAFLAWIGDFRWKALGLVRGSFRAWLVVLAVFVLLWGFIALTGIGITPDVVGWGDPAVPLLEWQFWLCWFLGIIFLLYLLNRRWPARRDWFLAAAIWCAAVAIWLSQPVHTAYFATAGRTPNYEVYPFSDGAYYGQFAQSILIGNGFMKDQVPPRPLYILLLAGFHAMAGQSYERVIVLQTLLMAFFPVVLYFIGKELHSRPAGLIMAFMAILRELTGIITVAITEDASTSQLFFADLPSALALSLWALMAVRWLNSSQEMPLRSLLAGGALGTAMLFRTQIVFTLIPVIALGVLAHRKRWAPLLRQVTLLLFGLALVLSPWLYRNWRVTATLAFDDPVTQTGIVAQRYRMTEGSQDSDFIRQPGEEISKYAERAGQEAIRFILEQPAVFARFVTAHLLNAEIGNVLLLSVRSGIAEPRDLLVPSSAFWENWKETFTFPQYLVVALNLGLLALGIGTAWSRRRWAGLALLFINIFYNASNALARNSGWRYLLPADWIVLVYAGIGLMELAVAAGLVLGISPAALFSLLGDPGSVGQDETGRRGWPVRALAGVSLFFLLWGSMLPLAEVIVPVRYSQQSQEQLAQELMQSSLVQQSGIDVDALRQFLTQPGVELVKGRALYPRYYAAGEGEPLTAAAGYAVVDYPRAVLLVVSNTYNGLVVLRSAEPPVSLPNAADVLLLGCHSGAYLDAYAALVLDSPGNLTLASDQVPKRCESSPGPAD